MNNRFLTSIVAILSLTMVFDVATAQEYVSPKVVISKEKVRSRGKVYYSHVVQERQTLFSICKAYGVTQEEVFEANPTLNLQTEGLKKNQILMIPVKDVLPLQEEDEEAAKSPEKVAEVTVPPQNERNDDYFIHRVKWFEDLDAVAKKYKVSKESILNINGMTSDKVRRKQELKIPRHPEDWEGRTVTPEPTDGNTEEVDANKEEKLTDTTRTPDHATTIGGILDEFFVREGRHDVSLSMLIPFSASRAGDRTSFMDFYCGTLLAAKALGGEGINLDINTFDVSGGNIPLTYDRFAASDFAIGPVTKGDILKASGINDGATWIVSPLDMQAETLADTLSHLIQAPTPTAIQVRDMVNWIKEDMNTGDKVIVVSPNTSASSYGRIVEDEMTRAGLPHSVTTLGSLPSLMTSTGTNRIVLSCDFNENSTVFLIEAVRHLYLQTTKRPDIILYSTSKIRTYDQIEAEQLHKINLHASVTYFVDYESKDVKEFLLQYRALFGTEPSRSAYSGYDLTKYFSTLAHKYGKKWPRALDRVDYKGLQSDFDLKKTDSGSFINNAVRRVVYNPDYSITLVR